MYVREVHVWLCMYKINNALEACKLARVTLIIMMKTQQFRLCMGQASMLYIASVFLNQGKPCKDAGEKLKCKIQQHLNNQL